MLWAASCLAFSVFLQVGEFIAPGISQFDHKVHLSVADISVDSLDIPSIVFISLKQSKIDQLRKDITVVLGRTNKSPLCPESALLSYLVVRGLTPGLLFIRDNGKFLTRAHFVEEVHKEGTAACWSRRLGFECAQFSNRSGIHCGC